MRKAGGCAWGFLSGPGCREFDCLGELCPPGLSLDVWPGGSQGGLETVSQRPQHTDLQACFSWNPGLEQNSFRVSYGDLGVLRRSLIAGTPCFHQRGLALTGLSFGFEVNTLPEERLLLTKPT